MLTHAEFRISLLNELTPEEFDRVMPLIEKQLLDSRQQMKIEAIDIVKHTFPDPHEDLDDCSDCLLIEAVSETLEVYLRVGLVEEHE